MESIKIKLRKQLKKEGIIAKQGYGNGYSLFNSNTNQMIGFIPFSDIDHLYYDWESNNKGYNHRTMLQCISDGGYLN